MKKYEYEDVSKRFASIRRKNSVYQLNSENDRRAAFKMMKATSLLSLVALVIIYVACRVVFGW